MQELKPEIAPWTLKRLTPSILAGALVLLAYVWFISAGNLVHWPTTSNYYSQLAQSFRQGQLALQAQPDPALLALPNPYDPKARKNVPFLSDASLFEGRYYLYWGPVPSLILAAWMNLAPGAIGDQFFAFIFSVGTFIFEALLILELWRRFFPSLPRWMVPLAILLAGLSSPFTRMLVHPLIYEASIAGGQFFLIGGFYFAYQALAVTPVSRWRMGMAGLFWACAVGTRTSQIIPIALLVMLLLGLLLVSKRYAGSFSNRALPAGALVLPLFLGGLGLAWYNWARFHSIFEFGYYYQLAGFNMQSFYRILYSRYYILQNLYNYLLNPIQLAGQFPFLQPMPGKDTTVLASYNLPDVYVMEGKMAGILWSFPFVIFSAVPVAGLILLLLRNRLPRLNWTGSQIETGSAWLDLGLVICFGAAFASTMMFFFAATRYMGDFFPFLSLVSITGFWEAHKMLGDHPVGRRWIAILGGVLSVYSILVTTILAFATRLTWFTSFNPGLMNFLKTLFGG